jgi:hypothetical protein
MSANGFAAGFRERLSVRGAVFFRRAALFCAAFMVLLACTTGEVKAQGTVTSVTPNTGPASGGTAVTLTLNGFAAVYAPGCGQTITVNFGANPGTFTGINGLETQVTAISPPGSGTVNVTVTASPGFFGCAPGGTTTISATDHFTYAGASSTDSQNLRALQVAATQTVAAISGQVITGQVEDAIDDAFNNGTTPITPGPNGLHFNFAAEPQQDAATQEAFDALAYAANVYKAPPSAPLIQRDWSVWADARGTGFDQNIAGGSANDKQINVTGGVARKLNPNLQVGIFTGYENFDFTSPLIGGKMTGSGGTIGSYAAWRFVDHWRLDGMFGWSDIFYNGTAGAASGSFTGSRWLGSGGFTGDYRWAGFLLQPSARIYTLWENDTAFTDSLGTQQAARNFSASRVSVGDKVSYPWQASPTLRVTPYVGLYTDYRFSSDNALPVGIPYVGIQNGFSERVTAGATWTFRSGPSVSLGGELGGIGAGYDLWSANARLDWPF